MKHTERILRKVSGALLFACGLGGLVWRAASADAPASPVFCLLLLSSGFVLLAAGMQHPEKPEN